MLRIDLYATEYLERHTDMETKTAVEKALVNARIIRRGINIAVEDKFNTDAMTNPYYEDLCRAGVTEKEFPILADFFSFVTEREREFEREWVAKHQHTGNIRQVTPAFKNWKAVVIVANTPQENK